MNRRIATLIKLSLLSLIACFGTIQSYVFKVDLWSNGKQDLYCLSDGHYPTPLSIEQTKQFTEYAKEKNGSVIVEDILDYSGPNAETKKALANFQQPELHFLPGLTSTCRDNKIDIHNVEFRQLCFASRQGFDVSAQEVYNRSEQTKREAAGYRDGNVFDTCYQNYFKRITSVQDRCEPYVKQLRNNPEPLLSLIPKTDYPDSLDSLIAEYGPLPTNTEHKKKDIIKLYDAPIIDLAILHHLAHNKHKNIFICAGGHHIEQLKSSFKNLGYTKLDSVEGSYPIESKPNYPYAVNIKDAFNTLEREALKQNFDVSPQSTTSSYLPLLLLLGLALSVVVLSYRKRRLALLIPFVLFTGIATQVKSYVYQVDVWSNGTQDLYCLSDEHYPAQVSIKQKKQLLDEAKKQNGALIVEDMLTYEKSHPEIDKLIQCYHDGSYRFLNLARECQEQGIPVTNTEFRHAGNASLAGFKISSKEVFGLSDQIKQEVTHYKDGPLFDKCYQQYLDELQTLQDTGKPFFKQLCNKNETLYHALPKARWLNRLNKMLIDDIGSVASDKNERKSDLLTMYDAALIDMRILHAIAQYPDNQPLFICAGGWHIQHLENAFKQLGYNCIKSISGTTMVHDKEDDCLPQAVELDKVFNSISHKPFKPETKETYTLLLLVILALAALVIVRRHIIRLLKKHAVLLILLGLPALLNGHIYRVEKWSDEAEKHNIFTFHDHHTSRLPENQKTQQQRSDIVTAGQQRNATVVVEDMYLDYDKLIKNPTNYDPHSVKTLRDKDLPSEKTTPLIALTPACKDASVSVVNVEFRQPSLLSNGGRGVSAQDCLKATQRVKKQVAQFNDTPLLNEFYKNTLEKHTMLLNQGKPLFDQIRNAGDTTIEDLFDNNMLHYDPTIDSALKTFGWTDRRLQSATEKQKIESLVHYYDVGLIDASIVHALYTFKDKPNIFVCAGFKHIENIEEMLIRLGYKKTAEEGKGLLEGNTIEPSALNIAEAMKNLDPDPIGSVSNWYSEGVLLLISILLILIGIPLRHRRRSKA